MHRRARGHWLRSFPKRIARSVRALFGSSGSAEWPEETEGGVGVREPRRPLAPTLTGAAALDLPTEDGDDLP